MDNYSNYNYTFVCIGLILIGLELRFEGIYHISDLFLEISRTKFILIRILVYRIIGGKEEDIWEAKPSMIPKL